ncbi:MAG: phosphoribosylglycinamide formyltransferase [bacterium]
MIKDCRIVVLLSGSGSNFQAILDRVQSGDIEGEIVAVISNRPGVKGLQRAQAAGIPTQVVDHTEFEDRASFDQTLINAIDPFSPTLLVLAGFMRILTPEFVNHYLGRLLNIHPSRLPLYKGLHTHQRAIEAGDAIHGASVHFVTAELDGGPVIAQTSHPILPRHNPDTLAQDLLHQEHRLYPEVVKWFCNGSLTFDNGHAVFKGTILSKPLQLPTD